MWVPDETIDTTALKGSKSRVAEEQVKRDNEADQLVLSHCNCQAWTSISEIRKRTGIWHDRLLRAAKRLVDQQLLERRDDTRRGKDCVVFRRLVMPDS